VVRRDRRPFCDAATTRARCYLAIVLSSEPTIRAATVDDALDLAALRWSWRVDEHGEHGLTDAEFTANFTDWFRSHRDSHIAFIAEAGDSPIGMAWLALIDRVPGPGVWLRLAGHLQSVYVLPARRGEGLGSALVTAVLKEAADRGMDYVSVHPSERSFALYQRLGFRSNNGVLEADLRSHRP
jgi:GNAT superfamily N-acetyltransferase